MRPSKHRARSQAKRYAPNIGRLAAALAGAWVALTSPLISQVLAAEAAPCRHAVSLIGAPKMAADFKHFDWVNPDAPKGGTLRQFAEGTFDTLNQFSDKGVKAANLGSLFDSLMASSPDEPSTSYGLIAECVSYPDDFSSATFKLRPEAKFHDGSPVTPDDVVFSFDQMKKVNAAYAFYWKNITKAEKTGDHEVTFTFDSKGNRELPMIIGELSVVSKAFYTGKSADGEPRDLSKTTVEVPLGNGAYKIKSVETSRKITYERVADYWAKDLPVMKGQFNIDTLELTYYRDRTPGFEDFKSGRIDLWVENVASDWATKYDFEALKSGRVKKEAIPVQRVATLQAFVFNTRRKQFSDPRVRQAFNLLLNFEEANKKLFYDLYIRVGSFFENSELQSKGLPDGRELEILNEVKSEVPPEVFTTEWKNPLNKDPGDYRRHQQAAMKLFNAAGWTLGPDRILKNAAGEPFVAEFLLDGQTFERITLHYLNALEPFGIKASVRVVDSAQYKLREDKRDFDAIIDHFGQTLSPGNEQRQFWGAESADKEASRNTAGIKNPAIEKLIDKVVFAKDRAELVAATKALDRVLLWNFYVVPHWHYPFERLAYWDMFGRPAKLPSQTSAPVQVWWIDAAKAKAVEGARAK
ncbi:MAG: ABC transporter substrate-binding protein [Hyphomicrobium sp.]|nr:ABC transporter substrate-binding protein [Hyphomicrobium sp.]